MQPVGKIMQIRALLKLWQFIEIAELSLQRSFGVMKNALWLVSGGGGNLVGTVLKILEKLSYIEIRRKDQAGHSNDVSRWLRQGLEESL